MTEQTSILSATQLRKQFRSKGSPLGTSALLTAVDSVTLSLPVGTTLGIAGESGCGKSTLAKMLAGLLPADSGQVRYCGSAISSMNKSDYSEFRRQTQMIFQDPFSSLNPRMRIGDTIGEPLLLQGGMSADQRLGKIAQVMETVGLSPDLFHRFPHEFSGGQRQRIGIARALASSPRILIADEPVSSLDISIQAQIINLLQEMKASYNLSMVMVSHDLSVLRHVCDRICIMYLGIIVEDGPASQVFQHCQHPYTQALISAIPRIGRQDERPALMLTDDIPSPLAIPGGCRFHTRCRYAEDICRREVPALEEKHAGHRAACHRSRELF